MNLNSRPSRSSSIPIPRSASSSSSARNIEAVLSIPVVSPSRQNVSSSSSARPSVVEPRRIGSSTDGSRAIAGNSNNSVSPTRSTTRSLSLVSSVPGRTQNAARTPIEPRIIRGLGPENFSNDDHPSQSGTSPSQNRRVGTGGLRASGSSHAVTPQHIVAPATHASFERPAYLDHSCFRHLLQTEGLVGSVRKMDHNKLDIDDDGTFTAPTSRQASSTAQPQDQVFNLPTRWSEQHRHQNLTISPDGRDLSYHGPPSNGEKDASVARTNYGVPAVCGIYYFEVEIQGKDQKAHISIGFGARNIKTSRMPGCETNSWGYYGENGTALAPEKSGSPYGPSFGAGDIIGCGIDFTNNTAFYTKNGSLIGPAFHGIGKNMELYPIVGLQHVGEVVHTNFGQDAFKFDIDYYVQRRSSEAWTAVQSTPLHQTLLQGNRRRILDLLSIASITNNTSLKPAITDDQSKSILKQLVMSYLVHHGYVKTARAFGARGEEGARASTPRPSLTDGNHDVEMTTTDAVENDIETRTSIVNMILTGNIESAIDAVREHYPSVLKANDQLFLFKLRCRRFVELILETAEIKKKMMAGRKREPEQQQQQRRDNDTVHTVWVEEEMDIDIIDDQPASPGLPTTSYIFNQPDPKIGSGMAATDISSAHYETALNAALLYGQALSNDCQSESRPELQQLFKQTFGIVAWEDPLEAGGSVADLAGHDARVALANEINEAILKSQGRPAQPALETLFRHTSVCVNQLGMLGVGAAAYADMHKEYILQ